MTKHPSACDSTLDTESLMNSSYQSHSVVHVCPEPERTGFRQERFRLATAVMMAMLLGALACDLYRSSTSQQPNLATEMAHTEVLSEESSNDVLDLKRMLSRMERTLQAVDLRLNALENTLSDKITDKIAAALDPKFNGIQDSLLNISTDLSAAEHLLADQIAEEGNRMEALGDALSAEVENSTKTISHLLPHGSLQAQIFQRRGLLRDICLDVKQLKMRSDNKDTLPPGRLQLYKCHGKWNQRFYYEISQKRLKDSTGGCVTLDPDNFNKVFLGRCNDDLSDVYQQWFIDDQNRVRSFAGQALCLEGRNNNLVQILRCSSDKGQQFQFPPNFFG